MASNSEYEQRRCFEDKISEQEKREIVLKQLIDEHNLKEKFRKYIMNAIVPCEIRIEFKN